MSLSAWPCRLAETDRLHPRAPSDLFCWPRLSYSFLPSLHTSGELRSAAAMRWRHTITSPRACHINAFTNALLFSQRDTARMQFFHKVRSATLRSKVGVSLSVSLRNACRPLGFGLAPSEGNEITDLPHCARQGSANKFVQVHFSGLIMSRVCSES